MARCGTATPTTFGGTFLKCPLEYPIKSDLGLGNTIYFGMNIFLPPVFATFLFQGTHSHFPVSSQAKECLAAAQTQKKSVEEILAASKDWDLDLTHLDAKEIAMAMGHWRAADGTTDFLSICSIILLAKDWGIQF